MKSRRMVFAALLALLLAGLLATSADARRHRRRGNRPLPVQIQKAALGRIGRSVRATGTVYPKSEVKLMGQAEGRVLEVLVREGDRVERGQILAKLDATLHEIELRLAESELDAVRARLKKIKAGYLPQEIATARAELAQARAGLARGQAELSTARARLEEAEVNAKSLEALFKRGVVSRQEWVKVSTEASRARSVVSERRASLKEEAARIQAAKERLKLKRLGSRREDIEAARAEEQKAIQKVNLLRVRLEYFLLRAPISSVVIDRRIEPGDLAVNRAHLFTLAHLRTLLVRGRVSELDMPRLRRRQKVTVEFDAYPGRRFTGELTRIFPQVDPRSRQAVVEVQLPNPDYTLRPGLFARLRFSPSKGGKAIILPAHAVEWVEGGEGKTGYVFVLKRAPKRKKKGGSVAGRAGAGKRGEAFAGVRRGGGGKKEKKGPLFMAVRRKVKLGETADRRVEIVGGLEVGEKVIVSAIGQLKNGRLVRVVE
ncbi:MAG: efflux RND transporter periplasmic adaptor subunit [bacterium]